MLLLRIRGSAPRETLIARKKHSWREGSMKAPLLALGASLLAAPRPAAAQNYAAEVMRDAVHEGEDLGLDNK